MAYDFIRWGFGIALFILLSVILVVATKKKGKSIFISAFASIIAASILMFIPVESKFLSFTTVESAFSYRHHEEYVASAQCNSGAIAVGRKKDSELVYYTVKRYENGYKIMSKDCSVVRSSAHGVYVFADFGYDMVILTKVKNSKYNGKDFHDVGEGFYSYEINYGENFEASLLTCGEDKVTLI